MPNLNAMMDIITTTIRHRTDVDWLRLDKFKVLEIAYKSENPDVALLAILVYWAETNAKK